MPGENCATPGCSNLRKDKISILKVPLPNNDVNKKWNKELIILKKTLFKNIDSAMSLWISVFNLINYLFVRGILLLIKYVFTQVVNRWKKVLYQHWIFHVQVPMPMQQIIGQKEQ